MNPQQILQLMMGQNPQINNNPMMQNALQMMNSGNVSGIQNMVQNICKSRGMTVDDLQNQVKQRFGLR